MLGSRRMVLVEAEEALADAGKSNAGPDWAMLIGIGLQYAIAASEGESGVSRFAGSVV